jgi:hypothetical protein
MKPEWVINLHNICVRDKVAYWFKQRGGSNSRTVVWRFSVQAFVRPHGAFDLSKLETPVQMFYQKMEDREALVDPEALTREEMIL